MYRYALWLLELRWLVVLLQCICTLQYYSSTKFQTFFTVSGSLSLIDHQHSNTVQLTGMYIIFVYAIWPLLRRDTDMRKHHLRLATISTLLLFFTLGSAQVAFLIGEMLSPSKYAKLVFACAQSVVYFLTK